MCEGCLQILINSICIIFFSGNKSTNFCGSLISLIFLSFFKMNPTDIIDSNRVPLRVVISGTKSLDTIIKRKLMINNQGSFSKHLTKSIKYSKNTVHRKYLSKQKKK